MPHHTGHGIPADRQTVPDKNLVDAAVAIAAMGSLVGFTDQHGQAMVADPFG